MDIEIKLPILIIVDSVGAINLSKNFRTKHIDIRQHFVHEFVEDGIIKIIIDPTDDNEADINNKITMEAPLIRHTKKNLDDIKNHQVNNRMYVRTRSQN
jgi:hypothetical protein